MAGVTEAVGTGELAAFALELDPADIPAEVTEAARLHLLDTLGCGLAAAGTGVGGEARAAVAADGGPASIIGSPARGSAPEAALANGTLCHALDYDDTHPGAIAHIGTVMVPAALAAAQVARADGRALLAALVAGSEIAIRIGAATSAGFHRRGFHPTSVCGVFGAAAASARLLGLSPAQAANALGIAGSFAGGIFEYLADGSATKPLHAGWAAHGGILAAQIARHGGTGPASVLDGRFGIFATHNEGPVDLTGFATLGEEWQSPGTGFKAYPCCHYSHGCLDAVRVLQDDLPDPSEITAIEVEIPAPGVDLVLDPLDAKLEPRTPYEAKFSLPWSLAELLVHGTLDSASFTADAIRDPAVLALARTVTYRTQEFESFPGAFPGTVRIAAGEGRTFEATVLHERGHEHNAMSAADVIAKFAANAGLALPADRVTAVQERVLALDHIDASGLDALASALEEVRP